MGVGWASLIPRITGRRPGGWGRQWGGTRGRARTGRKEGTAFPGEREEIKHLLKAGAGDSARGQVLRQRYSQLSLRDPSQSWSWCSEEEEVPGGGEHSAGRHRTPQGDH